MSYWLCKKTNDHVRSSWCSPCFTSCLRPTSSILVIQNSAQLYLKKYRFLKESWFCHFSSIPVLMWYFWKQKKKKTKQKKKKPTTHPHNSASKNLSEILGNTFVNWRCCFGKRFLKHLLKLALVLNTPKAVSEKGKQRILSTQEHLRNSLINRLWNKSFLRRPHFIVNYHSVSRLVTATRYWWQLNSNAFSIVFKNNYKKILKFWKFYEKKKVHDSSSLISEAIEAFGMGILQRRWQVWCPSHFNSFFGVPTLTSGRVWRSP